MNNAKKIVNIFGIIAIFVVIFLAYNVKAAIKPTDSILINDLNYGGTEVNGTGIDDSFGKETTIYSDSVATFTNVPYKFYNAEYLRLPSVDNDLVSDSLITFVTGRDVDVYILRDSSVEAPNWLTSTYTLTTDTVMGSNGITYQVYKRVVSVGTTVTIGGNAETAILGSNGVMQGVFVKKSTKVANHTFFNENFNDFDDDKLIYGYNRLPVTPNDITDYIAKDTIGSRDVLHFKDETAGITFIRKNFNEVKETFEFEFDVYIKSGSLNNDYNRIWIGNNMLDDSSSTAGLAIESYITVDDNSGKWYLFARDIEKNNHVLSRNNDLDKWYTIKYVIDPVTLYTYVGDGGTLDVSNNRTFSVYIKESSDSAFSLAFEKMEFRNKTYSKGGQTVPLDGINTFIFGTGGNYFSDYYLDNVIIKPCLGIGASNITVDGTIINLSKSITSYMVIDSHTPADAIVELTTTADYFSHEITRGSNYIDVSLTNLNLDVFNFRIVFETNSVLASVIPHPDTNATITGELKDNSQVIHVVDTSSDELAVFEKILDFNNDSVADTVNTGLSFSFDIYLNSITASNDQKFIRVFLNQGVMDLTNYSTHTNTSVHSYLTPQNNTSIENMLFRQYDGGNIDSFATGQITQNTWHNIEYAVNFVTKKYDTYLDGVLIKEDQDFYLSNRNSADRIIIGSGNYGTADFYVRNINYHELTGMPIDGVIVDGVNLPEFDGSVTNYTYYTDIELTENSNVILDTNSFYESNTTPVINLVNQTIIFTITNNLGEITAYTITYANVLTRPVSKEELWDLITYARSLNEVDFTYNTWSILTNDDESYGALHDAVVVYNNTHAIAADYSQAYYNLDTALNGLLSLLAYNDYATASIDTIRYTNNLITTSGGETSYSFGFERVLDNGKRIYKDQNLTFRSVPYKYMNAEYMIVNNAKHANSLIVLHLLQSIDILVFKDRDAGPFTDISFTDTGEIATSNNGIVYKIYSKTYNLSANEDDNIINIEFENLINNYVTDNNNIVAFMPSYKANNNFFLYENFDDYSTIYGDEATVLYSSTELFERAWIHKSNDTRSRASLVEDITNGNYVNLVSNSGGSVSNSWSMSWMYKEMAVLKESLTFKYSVYVDTNKTPEMGSNALDNQYIRTWLFEGEPGGFDTSASTASGQWLNVDDKISTLMDMYIHNNGTNMFLLRLTTANTNTYVGTNAVNKWVDVIVDVDILNHRYKITESYVDDNGITQTKVYPTSGSYTFHNGDSNDYTNYVYFASRRQGRTNVRFKDISIAPVDSDMFTGINIDAVNSLSLYKDLTKDYLYKTNDVASIDINGYNPAVTITNGSTLSNVTSTITDVTNGQNNNIIYTNIVGSGTRAGTDGDLTYNRNYRVYYEVNVNKNNLVDLLKTAQSLKRVYYTSASYQILLDEIENSIDVLKNHTVSQTTVNDAYDALNYAITNLVSISNISYNYVGKLALNNVYDSTFVNHAINITKNSSFTANYFMQTRVVGYEHAGVAHDKYLVSDHVFKENTKITLIDFGSGTPIYYYYVVTAADYANNKTSYYLNDFIKDGTTDVYYNVSCYYENDILTANYNFIFDFNDVVGGGVVGEHSIKLNLYVGSQLFAESPMLAYTLFNGVVPVNMSIVMSEQAYTTADAIRTNMYLTVGTLLVDGVVVTDTTIVNKVLGIRFTLYEEDNTTTNISFSKGTTLEDSGTVYYLDNDGVLRGTKNHVVSSITRNYEIVPGYDGLTIGSYVLKAEVISSYDGINEGIVIATDTVNLEINDIPNCSIYAHIINRDYTVPANTSGTVDVQIDTICNLVTTDEITTVSLSKKNNNSEDDFIYTLLDYDDYVINSTATEYSSNIYQLGVYPNDGSTRSENSEIYTITWGDGLDAGLYKLTFDVRAGDIVTSDIITFLVK